MVPEETSGRLRMRARYGELLVFHDADLHTHEMIRTLDVDSRLQ